MGQLRELENMFSKNKYPSWTDRKKLASALHLDEYIVKTWFKNHRIKWKKQQGQTQPKVPREAPNRTVSAEKEKILLATTASKSSLSPGISEAHGPVPPEYPGTEQPNGADASACISSWDSQPYDLQEIFLGSSLPPWASILCDIGLLWSCMPYLVKMIPATLISISFPR
ncbi:paired-like homeodomain transcription factor LEUTX [Choloepus didactylus]|uniref:paired-like homeodomain transcription factor LEUTX n=1 Tax=Choloepus didactylus TaxID=27675 RepID=UPI00189F848B|nr:paired-like homeodomain transcription factor LEUTX [Choloepus didactylus]